MDIIDDVSNLLRLVWRRFGIDLSGVLEHFFSSDRLTNGEKRNLVRLIGTLLPLKPARRIRFHSQLIEINNLNRHNDSVLSSDDSCSTYNDTWLAETLGDNIIEVCRRDDLDKDVFGLTGLTSTRLTDEDIEFSISSRIATSTPTPASKENIQTSVSNVMVTDSCSAMVTDSNSNAMVTESSAMTTESNSEAVIMLEMRDELASLRKQINLLMAAQQQLAATKTSKEEKPFSPVCRVAPTTVAPPPPPPPPPPMQLPPPLKLGKMKTGGLSLGDMLKQGKDGLTHEDNQKTNEGKSSRPFDMAEILKDMGNIKLRSVKRSPGGTPIREPPANSSTDLHSMIAKSLKRRISCQLHTPEEKENASPDSEGEREGEGRKFGVVLKKVKKRLSLNTVHENSPDSSFTC